MNELRFWSKVDKTDGCWLWLAALNKGYGAFGVDGKTKGAHRISYELLVGPIPEGFHLDHLCRVRNCVNPKHLEPVDPATNIRRYRSDINLHTCNCDQCPSRFIRDK